MGGRPAVTQRYARHNLPTAGITVATRCTDFVWSGVHHCKCSVRYLLGPVVYRETLAIYSTWGTVSRNMQFCRSKTRQMLPRTIVPFTEFGLVEAGVYICRARRKS